MRRRPRAKHGLLEFTVWFDVLRPERLDEQQARKRARLHGPENRSWFERRVIEAEQRLAMDESRRRSIFVERRLIGFSQADSGEPAAGCEVQKARSTTFVTSQVATSITWK